MNNQLQNFYKEWINFKENEETKSDKNKKMREEMQEKLLRIENMYEGVKAEE